MGPLIFPDTDPPRNQKSHKDDDAARKQIRAWLRRQNQAIRNKVRRAGLTFTDEIPP